MHDVSIKLLAAVEGPQQLEDDVSPNFCQANNRIWCMMEQTAGGDKSARKKTKKQKTKNSEETYSL